MSKKSIWIISFSNLKDDPRVYRRIQWLAPYYDITTFGFQPSEVPSVNHVPVQPPHPSTSWNWAGKFKTAKRILCRDFEAQYWLCPFHRQAAEVFQSLQHVPDLVLANDIETLPIAFKAAGGRKILIDLHEYAPREAEDSLKWRIVFQPLMHYLCTHYLPKADAAITVCPGIAEEYAKNYVVRPEIMTNAPPFANLMPSPIEGNRIRMIHHGVSSPSRRIEEMIKVMGYLDERFSLDFMLMPFDQTYLDKMKVLSAQNRRIRFLPPVPMQELSTFAQKYDLGLYLLPPLNFNHLHALPNKFFEFIQARLAIAIGPSPEMSYYVNRYDCGIVGKSFFPKHLAEKLLMLTPDLLAHYKQRAHVAAQVLHGEMNRQTLLKIIDSLIERQL